MKMRSAMAALTVVVVLAATQTASANLLSSAVTETPTGATWSELRIEAGGLEVRCPVTLSGVLEIATMPKRAGTRIGAVSAATLGTCPRGSATVLRETLPWSITYNSFSGTLPTISSITLNLVGMAMRVEVSGLPCLFRTEAVHPARGIAIIRREESGELVPTEVRADETATVETGGGFFCSFGGPGHLSGLGQLRAGIGVSLI